MHHDVGVIGLGYVGLTFATALADLDMDVLGVEKRAEVVDMTNAGKPHFAETGLESVMSHVVHRTGKLRAATEFALTDSCDIYVITVGTPLDAHGRTNMEFIRTATRQVAENMRDGALVILRSTVAVGTARNVVAPVLAESGKSFQIAMCPERTLEGRAMQELRQLPQIVGADDKEARERAAHFFYKLTPTCVQVSKLETAELVKLVDNTYRDVQFGFSNEVARICDAYGVNALEVINGGKLGYPRTNVALPGLVGGPCLEKDPHILAQSLERIGITLDITPAARNVNERQPDETVAFLAGEVRKRVGGRAPVISLMGIAFKGIPATDDLRGAMSLKVLAALHNYLPEAQIRLYDPVCSLDQLAGIGGGTTVVETRAEALDGADCVIIANNHPALGETPPAEMLEHIAANGVIYDYWNHFSNHRPHEIGDRYYAVGNLTFARPS